MKTLVIKRYFLDIKEREALENECLKHNPTLLEEVLEWDDEELLERIQYKKKTRHNKG
ncbi:hypothetical protein ACNRWW_17450 [Metabacillus sp. HB246100]|uniref:hypothetical protein n=1 Tax=Bacillus weihaiensis TaxID=1547283 RepID=UPI002353E028|nr:hypothetical protein [Bacillus weihaiensis]